jgi:uncharacterized protein HemY
MGKQQDIQDNVILVIKKSALSKKEWDELVKILSEMEREKII